MGEYPGSLFSGTKIDESTKMMPLQGGRSISSSMPQAGAIFPSLMEESLQPFQPASEQVYEDGFTGRGIMAEGNR
jgi:hypothetical protein